MLVYNVYKLDKVKKAHHHARLMDLDKAQVHFQSSGMAKIPFLIDVSQKTTVRLAKPQTYCCARVQGKGCHFQKSRTHPGVLGSAGPPSYTLPFF